MYVSLAGERANVLNIFSVCNFDVKMCRNALTLSIVFVIYDRSVGGVKFVRKFHWHTHTHTHTQHIARYEIRCKSSGNGTHLKIDQSYEKEQCILLRTDKYDLARFQTHGIRYDLLITHFQYIEFLLRILSLLFVVTANVSN